MSRVALTTAPMLPSKCVICAKDADGIVQFIDFAADLDYYGAIVICEHCVRECIELLDAPVAALREQLVAKEEELEAIKNEYSDYRRAVNTVANFANGSFAVPDVSAKSDSAPEKSTGKAAGSVRSKGSKPTESDSNVDESDSSGGLENSSLFAG